MHFKGLGSASRTIAAVCGTVALIVGVTACGGSDEKAGSTQAGASDASEAKTSGMVVPNAGITAADVKEGTSFIGGKAGKATGSPIKVGLVVPTQGALNGPYLVPSAKSAAALINDKLGGVQGHPLQLVGCTFGATAEQGQACGAKLANDESIKAVLYVPAAAGTSEFHAALGGSKVSLCTLPSPNEVDVPNQFCTSSGPLGAAAMATYLKDVVHAKSVAGITLDDPVLRGFAADSTKSFAKLGIDQTWGFISPQATDVTAAVLTSKARTADAVLLQIPATPACVPVAKALKQLRIDVPVVSAPQCQAPSVAKALGGTPNWAYLTYGPTVEVPGAGRAEVQLFVDTLNAYKSRFGDGTGAFSDQLFGNVLLLARVFNRIGPEQLTTKAISSAFEAYPGPAYLSDPELKFGVPPMPSVGTLRVQFIQHNPNGTWSQVADGKWFAPPPAGH